MRDYPPDWPVTDGLDDTLPTLYLHLIGSLWPPATDDLPAGYAEVGSWNIDRDLVGSLLPGQVRAPSGFSVATAGATIGQPAAGRLAPWKTGASKVVPPDRGELIASFDGPTGATAFVLGTFKIDPISGKASEPSLSIELVEEWATLKRRHTTHQQVDSFGGDSHDDTDASTFVEQIADDAGFTHDIPALGNTMTSIYFPGETTAMECLQQLLEANLGAAFVTGDGTIKALTFEQLSGDGDPAGALDVLTEFADLEWVIDPSEAIDFVEIKYSPPQYVEADPSSTTAQRRAASVWVADVDNAMGPGSVRNYDFDPGGAFGYTELGGSGHYGGDVTGSDVKGTTGGSDELQPDYAIRPKSSGRFVFRLLNSTGHGSFLVNNADGLPSFMDTAWFDKPQTDSAKSLTWGVDEANAQNPLTIDFGKLIQNDADAQKILDRIVSRVRLARWRINSVSVKPDLRHEIGDLVWVSFPEEGLSTKALITSVSLAGEPGSITQTLDLAILAPLIRDFNEAWDAAHPGATIADFNTLWAGKTIADFNDNPLST